jgi:predicted O-linked N-acetylglucosamine transferase (SPINDLY family)
MTNPASNDPCPCGSGKKFNRCCGISGTPPDFNRSEPAQQGSGVNGDRLDVGQAVQSRDNGQLEQAQQAYQLGNALAAQGKLDQAVDCYERALTLDPDNAEVHNNLGLAMAMQGGLDRAVVHFERALALDPDNAQVHNNLGNAYRAQERTDQAIPHYERALALKPDDALVHNNLGLALAAQGRNDQSMVHHVRALALDPDYAEAHYNLGSVLALEGKTDQALAHYERALALDPDYAEVHNNLGNVLMLQGRIDQGVTQYERALALKPDFAVAHNGLLFAHNYLSDKVPAAVLAAHLDFARRWEAPLARFIQPHPNDRSPERRLRIGYVSGDFRQHSVGYFIEPVLAQHDHQRFEIFCYSNDLKEDEVTARLQSHADHWRRLVGLSDEAVAQQIRADQIDILLDLSGHTRGNRLLAFARQPAPVQVTWLGYPATTGLSAMDYRITDGFADPIGMTEHLHSEKLVRLPECFSCYRPPSGAPEVSGLPARAKGYVTFGSFNNLAKTTPEVMAVWAKILQAVPGSRLTLKNTGLGGGSVQQRVRETFRGLGVAPERLELLGNDPSPRTHLERYWSIDIGLDPFPYNGATTTCEALWMGVPVVALAGKAHAGRVGVSQLSNLGLTELVGNTTEEYIAVALRLARDLERLSQLRAGLRARLAASPLTDAPRFTRNLEQAYRGMWQEWCLKGVTPRVSV